MSALIPEECGGSDLGLTAASMIMEQIKRSGGNSGAVHGQMYNMGTLLRNGSKPQKEKYLADIAAGKLRVNHEIRVGQSHRFRQHLSDCRLKPS